MLARTRQSARLQACRNSRSCCHRETRECFYTYFSPTIPSFVLSRGNSSRSSFVEITRIGFKSYRYVYNFLIPLLQITDCILKTHGNPYPQQRMNELFVAVYNLKQTQLLTKNVQKSEKHVFTSENCLSLG